VTGNCHLIMTANYMTSLNFQYDTLILPNFRFYDCAT
jgi:hypothetical protein